MGRPPLSGVLGAGLDHRVAVALRVFFLVSYRPGLIGYSDTANYLLYARGAVFGDPVGSRLCPCF